MYAQLFTYNEAPQRSKLVQKQTSCDTWQEVLEQLEKEGRPPFIRIEYFDPNGKVMVVKRKYNHLSEKYDKKVTIFDRPLGYNAESDYFFTHVS